MLDASQYEHITTAKALEDFCNKIRGSRIIGFDTEFVSENRYRPELCLVQVATEKHIAIIDTMAVKDIDVFWNVLVEGDHITIAHAAREEFLFCYRACRKHPRHLFDVQLAAGFVGIEYPSSYGNLVSKLCGKNIDKGETRTDWRRRPLSNSQIDYALQDVLHLEKLHRKISSSLEKLGRTSWFDEEVKSWLTTLEETETKPQWRRVSGISNLKRGALAIVRELWIWRDQEAERINRSPKRTLPDDLLVELAKRGSPEIKKLKAIRGLENRISGNSLEPISHAIEKALSLSPDQYPHKLPRSQATNLGLLGQYLTTCLHVVCKTEKIAPAIVGTTQDVRTLAAWKLGLIKLEKKPDMASGWRADIVGQLIEKVLDGNVALRVRDASAEQPLELTYLDD